MQYAALAPSDARFIEAVLARASELRAQYDKGVSDYTAAATAQAVVPPLAKTLSRTVQSLWRAARGG